MPPFLPSDFTPSDSQMTGFSPDSSTGSFAPIQNREDLSFLRQIMSGQANQTSLKAMGFPTADSLLNPGGAAQSGESQRDLVAFSNVSPARDTGGYTQIKSEFGPLAQQMGLDVSSAHLKEVGQSLPKYLQEAGIDPAKFQNLGKNINKALQDAGIGPKQMAQYMQHPETMDANTRNKLAAAYSHGLEASGITGAQLNAFAKKLAGGSDRAAAFNGTMASAFASDAGVLVAEDTTSDWMLRGSVLCLFGAGACTTAPEPIVSKTCAAGCAIASGVLFLGGLFGRATGLY